MNQLTDQELLVHFYAPATFENITLLASHFNSEVTIITKIPDNQITLNISGKYNVILVGKGTNIEKTTTDVIKAAIDYFILQHSLENLN